MNTATATKVTLSDDVLGNLPAKYLVNTQFLNIVEETVQNNYGESGGVYAITVDGATHAVRGVRGWATAAFKDLHAALFKAEDRGAAFRMSILIGLEAKFKCTRAASAGAYNNAKDFWAEHEPALVEGLGRPEGKNNGGRKKAVVETEVTDVQEQPVAEPKVMGKRKKKDEVIAESDKPESTDV